MPYWEGAGALGFGGGWFPLFGGMLGGMMLQDFLTPDVTVMADGDGMDGFGGGDFGGGDFGGGDF